MINCMSRRVRMKNGRYRWFIMILNINSNDLITKMIHSYVNMYILIVNLSND